MEISGQYFFDAPQESVWEALQDPNVLGSIMPGGRGIERVGENQYIGLLEVKVGPVQGVFEGQIKLSDIKPPESYRMEVDGKGAPGFVKASGSIRLEKREGQTYMEYSGQAQIGGRIASVGQRLMDSAARSIIRQSLEALNEYLKVHAAQQPETTPSSESSTTEEGLYKPPSQTTLAFNVARDVIGGLIPAKYLPIAAIVLVVIVIILLLASR